MSMSDLFFEHVLSSQYTVFDGLAGMHVEDIYQDRQGFLWGSVRTLAASPCRSRRILEGAGSRGDRLDTVDGRGRADRGRVAAGVYLARLHQGDQTRLRKMVKLE